MFDAPLTYLLAFLVALGILVVVHEFGHFIVARACGVKVLRFAVGFGQVLWSRRFGADRTEFALCAIPLGGYVKMVDEREGEVAPEDLPRAFTQQSLGKRSLIVFAGPLANLLLAIALYWGLFVHGVEELRPILGAPAIGKPAASAGVQSGDEVLSVNGIPVGSWEMLRWEVLRSLADDRALELKIRRKEDQHFVLNLPTAGVSIDTTQDDPMDVLGLSLDPPKQLPVIDKVLLQSPAEAAGLQPGDRILSVDGRPIEWWYEFSRAARASPGKPLLLRVQRNGGEQEIRAIPAGEGGRFKKGQLGVTTALDPGLSQAMFTTVSYPPIAAARKALEQTWDTAIFALRMMGRMVIGELSLKNLSGPLTIAEVAGQSVQYGMPYYIKFLALISISIGVLNLLPIPVLDGGHLMYYLAEFLRGKPLPERVFAVGQRIGLTLLLLMMGVALFNDLTRVFFG